MEQNKECVHYKSAKLYRGILTCRILFINHLTKSTAYYNSQKCDAINDTRQQDSNK